MEGVSFRPADLLAVTLQPTAGSAARDGFGQKNPVAKAISESGSMCLCAAGVPHAPTAAAVDT